MAAKNSGAVEHHISLKTYWLILGVLLVLTIVTVGAARVDFGALNTVIALGIASVKAGLVLAYFMHLRYDDRLFLYGFFIAIFLVVLLYLVAVVDWNTTVFFKDVVTQ